VITENGATSGAPATAFVLGGGVPGGASEVGMLRALGVAVHVLPAGTPAPSPADRSRYLNYRGYSRARDRIRLDHQASAAYLEATAR
jgi:hypothetical protein